MSLKLLLSTLLFAAAMFVGLMTVHAQTATPDPYATAMPTPFPTATPMPTVSPTPKGAPSTGGGFASYSP